MPASIFRKTATALAKEMSKDLIPAKGLVDAKYCTVGHLVVKRKKGFWQREKITPTAFMLADILKHEDADEKLELFYLPQIESNMCKYEFLLNSNAQGKYKVSVARGLVDVDFGARKADTISFAIDIVDNSLDIRSLEKAIRSRRIDPSHTLLCQARSRYCVCVVVTSLSSKSKVDVEATNEAESNVNTDIAVPGGTKMLQLGRQSESARRLQIPADTAMAYRTYDLLIRADGTIDLVVLPDEKGGFEKTKLTSTGGHDTKTYLEADTAEEDPGRELWSEIAEGMEAIFNLPDDGLSVIRKSLLELMTTPLLVKLNDLLQSAVHHLIVGDESSKVSCDALDEMIGGVSLSAHKDLLRVAGFVFGETEVTYPGSDKDGVLNCLADLLDVMAALREDQCRKLLQCTTTERSALMEMLAESISVDRLPLDQTRVTGLTEEFPHVESLLVSVGLHLERMDERWYLCQGSQQTGGESVTPGEMLAVIYALWGQ
ncbi:gasdermin-E-like [Diadema antillarum]|uniref:gasdermin-E-like n=1 Tax=Diadema antillarum TaxID=105358 RepID=UPI003A8AB893